MSEHVFLSCFVMCITLESAGAVKISECYMSWLWLDISKLFAISETPYEV